MVIAWNMRNLFGDVFEIAKVGRLLGNAQTLKAIEMVDDPRKIPAMWDEELESFRKMRQKYLIYK